MKHLIALQLASVLAHVGIASGYPQLRALYGSAVLASSFLAAVPLSAMLAGSIWGPIARRVGMGRAITLAVAGWSASFLLIGLFIANPAVAIALRAVHGVFDIAFASLPLAAATRSLPDAGRRRRFFGAFETAASVGAIVGPLTVGNLMLLSPRWAFIMLAAFAPLYLPLARGALRRAPSPAAREAARPAGAAARAGEARGGVPLHMLAPSLYAVGVIILISASEAFLPGFIEETTGIPWMGKVGVAVYEILVILGVLLKSRIAGTRIWAPALTGLVFAATGATAGVVPLVYALLAVSAVGIGMSLTMSHEFAAHTAGEDAEGGMSVYASIRISGGVIGPYVAALGFPVLLVPLAVVSLGSAPLLRADPARRRRARVGEPREM